MNEFTHTTIFSNRSLSGPSGLAAKHFQTTYGIPTQCQQATDFYGILKQDALQQLELNGDTIPRLAPINIPRSLKVRLVFGVGFGLRIIGSMPLTIANQYVMLSNEGEPDLGCPNVLTLPASIHQPVTIATITVGQFSTKMTSKGTPYYISTLNATQETSHTWNDLHV